MTNAEKETIIRWDCDDRVPVLYTADPLVCLAERVGFVPAILASINDSGLIRSPQITKSTQSLSIRYKTGTGSFASPMMSSSVNR